MATLKKRKKVIFYDKLVYKEKENILLLND